MLTAASRFFNDATGLEKTLRLVQCYSQVAAALAVTASDAAPWIQARSHFVVARRFFRMTKWIDAWNAALQHLSSTGTKTSSDSSIRTLLQLIKFSCLGMYMFLEMFTITDAMKVTSTTWGPRVLDESLKFWFYAIAASLLLSLLDLWSAVFSSTTAFSPSATQSEKQKDGLSNDSKSKAKNEKPDATTPASVSLSKRQIYKKLFTDGCDILIPGSHTGWIPADALTVGVTGVLATLVSMADVWARVNGGS
ncbi:hypothetical protein AAFC00_005679 [Neodothiora populina]|uniref:Peroxin 11B n=1 Tax=Neodothiora populina TaxID=2781224 RepID=A0ABR3P5G9_9PEZI